MIEAHNLTVQAGAFLLRGVNFCVHAGQYGVLMGKTGSGKTTLLEAICGLKQVRSGVILLNNQDVTSFGPAARGIGLVPQDGALFSSMSIERHLRFALEIRKWRPDAIADRVQELASLLQIEHLLPRRPHGLSGGERQRVALGRALSFRPEILCLDEPLSALDDETRQDMIALLRRVQKETAVTTLHVTHNRTEAEQLGDVLLRIEDAQLYTDIKKS